MLRTMRPSSVALLAVLLAACEPAAAPRAPTATGEPAPSASTSAEPLWISNQPRPAQVAK